ncbi:hypothetical protein ACFE04_021687 [Oxalis oulophora]
MTTSAPTINLKLLVDTKNQKVLFAEASKDFVDFLFSIVAVPAGELIGLAASKSNANGHSTLTCLENLHTSLQNLDQDYMMPDYQSKINSFKPFTTCVTTTTCFLVRNFATTSTGCFSKCSSSGCNGFKFIKTANTSATCPKCNVCLWRKVHNIVPSCEEEGYVKTIVKYTVTDDLTVRPMSAVSSITSLKTATDIKNFAALDEKEISFGEDKAMELLSVIFQSDMVLTDLFLRSNKK